MKKKSFFKYILMLALLNLLLPAGELVSFAANKATGSATAADESAIKNQDHVAVLHMKMMILPGTQAYLENSVDKAAAEGAKVLVVVLDTPGGILHTTQLITQAIFKSPVPIVIYVAPTGAMAASAGVFITLSGHVAAMAPGTSIGAAHPVASDGKNIEGDMREKAENMTIAMMKSISDQRGRNTEWAEKSVKESNSITADEALKMKVVDIIANVHEIRPKP